jgi:hypothetical protein
MGSALVFISIQKYASKNQLERGSVLLGVVENVE